jgi:hypothetical protein
MAKSSRNAFRTSNRSSLGSNTFTTQAQGGGSKKAGFPYQIGREYRTSIAFNTCDPQKFTDTRTCCGLMGMQYTVNPRVNISKPIGSTYVPNTYFHVAGTR